MTLQHESPEVSGRPGSTVQVPALEVDDLHVSYRRRQGILGHADVRAVDGVSFAIPRGRTLGLVGETGCGKTTTARAILRLLPIAKGRVLIDGQDFGRLRGKDLRHARRDIQMVFQDPYASLNPQLDVLRIVREPLDIHGVGTPEERTRRVVDLLELVGMSGSILRRRPNEFSGGQRQRIVIARALALNPKIIVADEPISALDVSIQAQVTNLLQDLQEELGLTYLYIAHDLAIVRHITHDVAVMYLGRIVELADTDGVFDTPRHPYTIALRSAVPIPDPLVESKRKRIILTGDVPSPEDPPAGCRFSSRCWLARRLGNPERCTTEDPRLAPINHGHAVACHFPEDAKRLDPES